MPSDQDTQSLLERAQALIYKPIGRPTDFNQTLASQIIEQIEQGYAVREICTREGMPSHDTVYKWLNRHQSFADAFYRAREASVEPMMDRTYDLAADDSKDVIYHGDRPIPNSAAVKRSELRVGFNQWLAGKWSKRYADKQQIEHSGTVTLEMATRLDTALRRLDVIDVQPDKLPSPSKD